MTERKIRMNSRDRLMRGEAVIGMIGPIAMPTREAIVAAVRSLAAEGVHTRVGLGFHVDGRNWSYDPATLDQWCDDIVVVVRPATADTIQVVAMQQAWMIDAEHPLRFVIAGDYLIQINDHALGDGVLFVDRLAAIVQFALGTPDKPTWATTRPRPWPLALAVWNTFIRNRQGIPALLAERRVDRSHPRERDSEEMSPWRPELAMVTAAAPVATLKSLQAWIRATDRTLTVSSALVVVLRRSFEAAGLTVQRDTDMVYNLRRYLPVAAGLVSGNFIAGLPLRVDDANDPRSVGDGMRDQLDSGRPLAALLIGVVRHALFGSQFQLPEQRRVDPKVTLVFNNLGLVRHLQPLPWKAPPQERLCAFAVRPDGPEEVTVIVVILAGVIHLTASFHSNVFTEVDMTDALQRSLTDPLLLLNSRAEA